MKTAELAKAAETSIKDILNEVNSTGQLQQEEGPQAAISAFTADEALEG